MKRSIDECIDKYKDDRKDPIDGKMLDKSIRVEWMDDVVGNE